MHRRKLAAGNWKMNGLTADLAEAWALATAHPTPGCDVLLCPAATLVAPMAQALKETSIAVGGQNCHASESGAHTGDISAAMLADAGASYVILGHSDVRAKASAALAAGLSPIICIGETLAEREAGQTLPVVTRQLAGSLPEGVSGTNIAIAYEPVWAIGTGKVATPVEIGEVHAALRAEMLRHAGESGKATPLLYGGSVKPSNAAEIFAVSDVDGALVGGASLKAVDFGTIIDALAAA